MDDMNRSCRDFTAVLASGEPTPGGGGAAALCGAVGAALCGMVASLTTGRKRYEAVETEIQQLLKRTNALQDELLEQAAADANRVTEALNAIAGIESRVSRVEDGLFNNITGNPFLASFDSLDGITLVKGIWNEERKRIEC